jgi:hypothetical protein
MITIAALSLTTGLLARWSSTGHDDLHQNVPHSNKSEPSAISFKLSIEDQFALPRSGRLFNQVQARCTRSRTTSDPFKYP